MTDFINVTTKMFFDRDRVVNAMDRKAQRCLSSAGAYGRTIMRRGMKRRKGISAPGGFPSAHAGQLKELIYFGYDAATKGVVIGPTLFKKDRELTGTTKTVPQLINEGGTVFRVKKVGRGSQHIRQTYRPRPFVELTRPHVEKKFLENLEKFDFK